MVSQTGRVLGRLLPRLARPVGPRLFAGHRSGRCFVADLPSPAGKERVFPVRRGETEDLCADEWVLWPGELFQPVPTEV